MSKMPNLNPNPKTLSDSGLVIRREREKLDNGERDRDREREDERTKTSVLDCSEREAFELIKILLFCFGMVLWYHLTCKMVV